MVGSRQGSHQEARIVLASAALRFSQDPGIGSHPGQRDQVVWVRHQKDRKRRDGRQVSAARVQERRIALAIRSRRRRLRARPIT